MSPRAKARVIQHIVKGKPGSVYEQNVGNRLRDKSEESETVAVKTVEVGVTRVLDREDVGSH